MKIQSVKSQSSSFFPSGFQQQTRWWVDERAENYDYLLVKFMIYFFLIYDFFFSDIAKMKSLLSFTICLFCSINNLLECFNKSSITDT